MKRSLYNQLVDWKNASDRKPLILRGARQVGKTYLLKLLGREQYASSIYLNFEKDPKLAELFTGELKPATLLERISVYTNQTIAPHETLLIFDEIQEAPAALNSLKYFHEEAN